jgi:glycosyltransferase involved in cell wall biosynthesis
MDEKVLMFYINTIYGGGAERVIVQLANYFSHIGYKSILVTSFIGDNEYNLIDTVERISLEQKQIKQSRVRRNLSRIWKLRQLCKEKKPLALISFMAEPNFRALLATKNLPVRNIVSVRNDPEREYQGKLGNLIGKYILPVADGCVFQTDEAKRWFPERLQIKSRVIFNEVEVPFFKTTYNPKLNAKGGLDIVSLGRLCKQKNQELMIRAFARIINKHPNERLLIYGIGDFDSKLELIIKSLHLEEQVILKGMTHNVTDVLSKAGVFILSSDYEGLPNALMEAMAVGVPCIATDCPCGGPRMLIENNVDGMLVPVGDEHKMAAVLDKILCDRKFAKKIGLHAKQRAHEFCPETVFEHWKDYIEEVIYS